MKHTSRTKLSVKRETVRKLSEALLAAAIGGGPGRADGRAPGRGTGPVDSCEDCTGGVAI